MVCGLDHSGSQPFIIITLFDHSRLDQFLLSIVHIFCILYNVS